MANRDEEGDTRARQNARDEEPGDPSDPARAASPSRERPDEDGQDVMHGRSFAGQNYANTERGQTADRERVVRHETLDEAGEPMVTDAEVEARISRRAERHED